MCDNLNNNENRNIEFGDTAEPILEFLRNNKIAAIILEKKFLLPFEANIENQLVYVKPNILVDRDSCVVTYWSRHDNDDAFPTIYIHADDVYMLGIHQVEDKLMYVDTGDGCIHLFVAGM